MPSWAASTGVLHVRLTGWRAIEMVRHTLVETRRSVWDIRSQALEGGDLAGALREAARQLSATTPIPVHVIGTPRALSKATENHLLRIGQEVLSNAVKHAEARHVEAFNAFNHPVFDNPNAQMGSATVGKITRLLQLTPMRQVQLAMKLRFCV